MDHVDSGRGRHRGEWPWDSGTRPDAGPEGVATIPGSPQPLGQDVTERLGALLAEGDQAFARDVGIEHNRVALLAHHEVGETHRAPVQPTRRGDRLTETSAWTVGMIIQFHDDSLP